MSKFVSFPLQMDDARVIYPDDINLFSDVVIVGDVVNARYLGDLPLALSDYFRQQLLASVIQSIKSAAFVVINEVDGESGWRRQRAEDKKALGDDASYTELLNSREAVRVRSSELETEAAALDYDGLLAFDPFPPLRLAGGL